MQLNRINCQSSILRPQNHLNILWKHRTRTITNSITYILKYMYISSWNLNIQEAKKKSPKSIMSQKNTKLTHSWNNIAKINQPIKKILFCLYFFFYCENCFDLVLMTNHQWSLSSWRVALCEYNTIVIFTDNSWLYYFMSSDDIILHHWFHLTAHLRKPIEDSFPFQLKSYKSLRLLHSIIGNYVQSKFNQQ